MPLYKSPKSIQQAIELKTVSEDGLFEVGVGKYSKTYGFADINYHSNSREEKIEIRGRYCKLLNSLEFPFKITFNGKRRDMEKLKEGVFLSTENGVYGGYGEVYNNNIEDKLLDGSENIEHEMYVTVTVACKDMDEARRKFEIVEGTLEKSFQEIGSKVWVLNGNERLQILYDYYHLGKGETFVFDLKGYRDTAQDFRNDLCNSMLHYQYDHFRDEEKYGRVLYLKRYPNRLIDEFLREIIAVPVYSMVSVDVVPVPKELTTRNLQKKYLGIESDIIKQQRIRNKNNDFASDISYGKRTEKMEIEGIMDDVRENDQCFFYTAVTILIVADSKEALEKHTETIKSIGRQYNCAIDTLFYKQREGINTALPIGVRQVQTMRGLLSRSLAGLMPFQVQELNHQSGIYYGINQISGNINIGNRKKLINGNGFIFGVPGSGKSFACKMEMGAVLAKEEDDVIIVDPMNEYFDVAKCFHGTVVNMSTYTDHYVNPLGMDVKNLDVTDSQGKIREKGEFMLGLCEQCMGEPLNARQKSIIDRCVRKLYLSIAREKEKRIPVMTDFYNLLLEQPEEEAEDIALALELFVSGSLNIFNHQTNVDMGNRFTVYGIRDLGAELSPITMLVMMEAIQQRIVENGKKGKATWLYVDECHVLLNSEYSAKYLQQLWKKVRKQGGLCTGITQNVTDLLQSDTITTMLSNSDFVVLLKQSNADSERMEEVLGISRTQLDYALEATAGKGLLKCGDVIVPFDNQIDKDSAIYKLYNTNLHEKG